MEILAYAADAVTPFNLVLAVLGVVIGTVLGALPGLSSTFSVAVMLPMTFTMAPVSALIFLGAVYTGSTYGGAYTAILLNTPGTPQNIATTFDGFPMAKRGDGNLAITLACLASVAGGLVGALALFAFAPPLAEFALAFGPVEYFWLAVLGLTLIATLSEGSLVKGGISGCFGMAISLIGIAVVSGDTRYTFDLQALLGGIHLVPAVIGLLCVPVLMDLVSVPQAHLDPPKSGTGLRLGEALRLAWRGKVALTRGAILGTVIGVLPAAGGAIASLVAYSETKRSAKNPRAFGTGEPDGVLTTESANNATVGGGLIPTFVLGIPGTPADAVILGALLVHGVRHRPLPVHPARRHHLYVHIQLAAGDGSHAAHRALHGSIRLPDNPRHSEDVPGAAGRLFHHHWQLRHPVRCQRRGLHARSRHLGMVLRPRRLSAGARRARSAPRADRRTGLRSGIGYRPRHRQHPWASSSAAPSGW